MFISDVFCGEISDVIYNVRKLHFCKCHVWYKHNLLTFFYLRFIIVFDHQTVSVSATATAERQSSVSALVSATAVTEYSVSAHFRLRPKPEKVVSVDLYRERPPESPVPHVPPHFQALVSVTGLNRCTYDACRLTKTWWNCAVTRLNTTTSSLWWNDSQRGKNTSNLHWRLASFSTALAMIGTTWSRAPL